MHKYVYLFSEGNATMRNLLGGKGANLAEMTALGMPVPQGFTVTTEACTRYYEDGRTIGADIQAQIDEALAKIEALKSAYPDAQVIEATLKENFGIKEIKEAVVPYLSGTAPFYPDDMITDKDMSFQAKEVIREKMLHFLRDEIPHSAAVKMDKFLLTQEGDVIVATIILDKENHKGIVIGKGGAMIKKISMAARQELERMWHEKIASLTLKVEVDPGWRDSAKKLIEVGYGDR